MTIWGMRISRYKHTLGMCNTTIPLQQWLHGRALMLRCTVRTLPVVFYILFLDSKWI